MAQGQITEVNDLTWPKFQLFRDFMPLLDTCKFEEVVIKTKGAMPRTKSNMGFFIRDFMSVLVIRKFVKISIENKVAVPGTTFTPL